MDEYPYGLVREWTREADNLAALHIADHEALYHHERHELHAVHSDRAFLYWLGSCLIAAMGLAGAAIEEVGRIP